MHLKILVAGDHAGVRKELKRLLSDEYPAAYVGEAANGEEVLKLCGRQRWDLILLDLNTVPRGGVEVLAELKQRRKPPAVMLLSMEPRLLYAERALKLGAVACVSKEDPPEELLRAGWRSPRPLMDKETN